MVRICDVGKCFPDGVQWIPGAPRNENDGSAGKFNYNINNYNFNIIINLT
jgi:hypothetical protein